MSEEGIQEYYKELRVLFDCPSIYQSDVTDEQLYNFDRFWMLLSSPPLNGESEEQRTARWMYLLCVQSMNMDIHGIPCEFVKTHPTLNLSDYTVFHHHRLVVHAALPHLAFLHWVLLVFCILYRKSEFRAANNMRLNEWFLHVVLFGDNDRFAAVKTSIRDYFKLVYYHYYAE